MRNKILITIITLLLNSFAFGQLARFKGGAEAGIVGSQIDGDDLGGYHKAGLRAGGFIERELKEPWSIQFGIYYMQKGSKGIKNPDKLETFYELNLHYIDFPLTTRYYHTSGIFGEAGAGLNYLFSQKEMGYVDGQYQVVNPGFNNFEFSGHLGIGYKIFPFTYIHAQFGYSILQISGRTQFVKNPAYNTLMEFIGLQGMYNNTLNLSLQVYLGRRK